MKIKNMNKLFEFEKDKFVGEGFTYDDVLLLPAYSEVLPVKWI
jgi:IMP dehydrogenase/GMP reductase